MTHKHIEIADKYAGEACNVYTLDGIKLGIIQGRLNQYATIALLDQAGSFEFSWLVIERKMQGDKLFYVC